MPVNPSKTSLLGDNYFSSDEDVPAPLVEESDCTDDEYTDVDINEVPILIPSPVLFEDPSGETFFEIPPGAKSGHYYTLKKSNRSAAVTPTPNVTSQRVSLLAKIEGFEKALAPLGEHKLYCVDQWRTVLTHMDEENERSLARFGKPSSVVKSDALILIKMFDALELSELTDENKKKNTHAIETALKELHQNRNKRPYSKALFFALFSTLFIAVGVIFAVGLMGGAAPAYLALKYCVTKGIFKHGVVNLLEKLLLPPAITGSLGTAFSWCAFYNNKQPTLIATTAAVRETHRMLNMLTDEYKKSNKIQNINGFSI